MKALVFTDSPHLMAKLGAWLVIVLGVINVAGLIFPKFPIKLRIPMASKETLRHWITKATVPAAFVAGRDQSRETETPAALDHPRHPTNADHLMI